MRIEIPSIVDWKVATKTKELLAKHITSIMVDRHILAKFLIDTLEGREVLVQDSMICMGAAADFWQQRADKLLKKYSVTEVTSDGWLVCKPIPGNKVNCFEVTQEFVDSLLNPNIHPNRQQDGTYYIIGQYGEQHNDGLRQWLVVGDYILQDQNDPTDCWVVAKKVFRNTYDTL